MRPAHRPRIVVTTTRVDCVAVQPTHTLEKTIGDCLRPSTNVFRQAYPVDYLASVDAIDNTRTAEDFGIWWTELARRRTGIPPSIVRASVSSDIAKYLWIGLSLRHNHDNCVCCDTNRCGRGFCHCASCSGQIVRSLENGISGRFLLTWAYLRDTIDECVDIPIFPLYLSTKNPIQLLIVAEDKHLTRKNVTRLLIKIIPEDLAKLIADFTAPDLQLDVETQLLLSWPETERQEAMSGVPDHASQKVMPSDMRFAGEKLFQITDKSHKISLQEFNVCKIVFWYHCDDSDYCDLLSKGILYWGNYRYEFTKKIALTTDKLLHGQKCPMIGQKPIPIYTLTVDVTDAKMVLELEQEPPDGLWLHVAVITPTAETEWTYEQWHQDEMLQACADAIAGGEYDTDLEQKTDSVSIFAHS